MSSSFSGGGTCGLLNGRILVTRLSILAMVLLSHGPPAWNTFCPMVTGPSNMKPSEAIKVKVTGCIISKWRAYECEVVIFIKNVKPHCGTHLVCVNIVFQGEDMFSSVTHKMIMGTMFTQDVIERIESKKTWLQPSIAMESQTGSPLDRQYRIPLFVLSREFLEAIAILGKQLQFL